MPITRLAWFPAILKKLCHRFVVSSENLQNCDRTKRPGRDPGKSDPRGRFPTKFGSFSTIVSPDMTGNLASGSISVTFHNWVLLSGCCIFDGVTSLKNNFEKMFLVSPILFSSVVDVYGPATNDVLEIRDVRSGVPH